MKECESCISVTVNQGHEWCRRSQRNTSNVTECNYFDKKTNPSKFELHKEICKQMTDTYKRKNSDYGDSFVKVRQEYPHAIIIRLMDKLERLKTLYKGKEQKVNDESIEDSLLDMANYCVMETIELRNNEDKK